MALDLWHNGVLDKYKGAATGKAIELIGASPEAIDKAEDRPGGSGSAAFVFAGFLPSKAGERDQAIALLSRAKSGGDPGDRNLFPRPHRQSDPTRCFPAASRPALTARPPASEAADACARVAGRNLRVRKDEQ